MEKRMINLDGNGAVAHVAHATNEVIAIYPITPSSNMGEMADEMSAMGKKNIWGNVPNVVEMQSEAGAAGAVHGALSTGSLTTTFTASQGLLLMIPNMYKIAGELTPTVFHVSARALATHALSIFGDHQDVMAARQTGWSMLASSNPQECMDNSLIAQAATLRGRVPVLHFFDGFRTSHEIQRIEEIPHSDMLKMLDNDSIHQHRARSMNPENPTVRGTAQNPDVYFASCEASNKYYDAMPGIVQEEMDRFAKISGRQYNLVNYYGAEDAKKVIVVMASGADVCIETAEHLASQGEKVGVLKVRLYRPFPLEAFIEAMPGTVEKIAVLDRTKESGSIGEPLYLDVRTTMWQAIEDGKIKTHPTVVGGRFGLGSKDFTPAMVKAVYDNLGKDTPINSFTVGIEDDVTNLSLEYDPSFVIRHPGMFKGLFYGLGSDGTVGANKNTTNIIGENTDNNVQTYFVYDSKKAGSVTVSHVRFGEKQIRSSYLIQEANFVACHNFSFVEKYDMLRYLEVGGTFLLNSPFGAEEVWDHLPEVLKKQIVAKQARFYVIDAVKIAEELGLGSRINVILQTAFFKISKVLDFDKALSYIKDAAKKSYGRYGDKVVEMNIKAIDAGSDNTHMVKYPGYVETADRSKKAEKIEFPLDTSLTDKCCHERCSDFIKDTTPYLIANRGEELPVSQLPADGVFPTATTMYEKRNIAVQIPVWEEDICIQCCICSFVCPHAAIRAQAYEDKHLEGAPDTFKHVKAKGKDFTDLNFTIQVAPEDCTGCNLCVANCPAKSKTEPGKRAINMQPQAPLREAEVENYEFFLNIPALETEKFNRENLKGSQLTPHLFEYSGACAGCGETPYLRLVTHLFGDRLLIANATGCSSIYGGNLPTTPYALRSDNCGPAWGTLCLKTTQEYGMGMKLATDKLQENAYALLDKITDSSTKALVEEIKNAEQKDQTQIEDQKRRVRELKEKLAKVDGEDAKNMISIADYLLKRSVWVFGGDGWAYDIGYGGLDHVLASGEDINLFVFDTEVYSNTGGQASKSTPIGASAKFAVSGREAEKKDLGMISMTYGNIYVAQVSLSNPTQCLKAIVEAEKYKGPSLIIAYSPCIEHGIQMSEGIEHCKRAVNSGYWMLYRYNPDLVEEGKNPLQIDCKPATISVEEFMSKENRFKVVQKNFPENYKKLVEKAEQKKLRRNAILRKMSEIDYSTMT